MPQNMIWPGLAEISFMAVPTALQTDATHA
jgi:hypothetical protein